MNIDSRALARAPLAGRLGGRTAIITGGANGMGLAAVRMFAEAGAKVAILDIAAGAGRAAEAELTAHGHNVMFIETDVTRSDAVRAALAQVNAAWGPVDTLFSHAGTIIVKPLHESTDEDYDRLMLGCFDKADALRDAGCLHASQQLQDPGSARTLRVRDGVARITDGPFAETREFLAGFNLIEAVDIDAAMQIASAFPWSRFGSIEVRPVRDMQAVRHQVGAD